MQTPIPPILRSLPQVDKLHLPPRAETLAQIESGELEHIDFTAHVFGTGKVRNPYEFRAEDLGEFARSFAGQPFLRNHDTRDIDARDGTIIEASQDGAGAFEQTIRLTTRRGMTSFVEGQIDRFSIGWHYDDVMCTICNSSFFSASCTHWPGQKYQTPQGEKTAKLLFINPQGKETSAVNDPAVEGTGLLWADELQQFKLSINGAHGGTDETAVTTRPAPLSPHHHKVPAHSAGRGVRTMTTPTTGGQEAPAPAATLEQIEQNRQTAAAIAEAQAQQDALASQLAASNAVLIAQCAHLLDTGLAASNLPEPTQSRIRKTFEGRAFGPAELSEAITAAKAEIAAVLGAGMVQGPGRVSQVFNGADQFAAAVYDLLGAPREPGSEALHVARLTGIREAYLLATGDREFTGGWFPEFALDTANFPVIVKNALNKRLTQAWSKYGAAGYDWWSKIVSVEHFETLQQVDWLITGTIGTLPTVAERAEYTELPIGDNGETSDWTKYGGYVGLTLESILRDDVRAFRRLPDEVAMGGIRNVSEQVAAIFTSNSGVGPTLSDGGALFNNTAVTTAGGHANLLTTALGTSLTAWRAIESAMYVQPMHVKNEAGYYGTGKPQGIRPKFLLVPIELSGPADDLFLPSLITTGGTNIVKGQVTNLVVPEWTDATDYAAVADPNILPGIMLGEMFGVMPQIFLAGKESDPAFFANDESRIKIRQFLTVGIANWRALHKSNVAGS